MIRRFKSILILSFFTKLSNCYLNPLIQKFIVTEPKEEYSLISSLSLLTLSPNPFALSLTGQIRNENGSTVTDAILRVTNRSNEMDGLYVSATTDVGGRF
ncbi:carboxypeptidase-like regulatory domain-containing protein [Leptospira bouyouniensis]|uniref:carboxypeptidase-like regulatory domain-containing protein n=1 Tax=Leptospira bouyouniensis TaxID=2484911 RepID=UPI001FC971D9|nr:carboxypeptidase-like regulatory domain-containing protein [Leptospira bouyouniensis]